MPRPPRIGLALGGGAARGFAHIGVIQVLEEAGIKPQLVVGTSAGSLVAALYATGMSGAELGMLAVGMDESALTDWSFPGRGVIRGEALARYVREQTGGVAIERMKLPLGIVATDLDSGQAILFQRGDAGTAVRASSAVPAVFQPVKIGEREYVDGGLVSPVPVRFARQMGAELVLAVDISTPPEGQATGDAMRMLLQTFAIMGRASTPSNCATPMWCCARGWPVSAAPTSARASARSWRAVRREHARRDKSAAACVAAPACRPAALQGALHPTSLARHSGTDRRAGPRAAGQRNGHVWTINDPARALQLWRLGVQGIISDDPGLLLAARQAGRVQA